MQISFGKRLLDCGRRQELNLQAECFGALPHLHVCVEEIVRREDCGLSIHIIYSTRTINHYGWWEVLPRLEYGVSPQPRAGFF
ncbi:hypothetical protein [Cylindrospermum sp. FACHB-282]|uniref:hypothetical protein n=1 Tax=Cylindrospermum sp. FACHB-282 TaxID=2692794 RepID=UPI0016884CD8|nr:hypothetical protein [Cylindrospermum sp. FACHB-282]MBD2388815.1 hypothetical protein [Cylindrospermum sp. FACHB-282]